MKKVFLYIIGIITTGAFTSCEKVIDLKVPAGDPVPYVDAWINDKPGPQQIKFLKAVGYLDNSAPPVISDAEIKVTDLTDNKTYDFIFSNGAYTHDPGPGVAIGISGHQYKLSIKWQGETFEAIDKLNRVPPIDSITYEFKEESNGEKEGYYAKFFAKDLVGATDYYWIRTFRNGVLNQNVNEMWSIDGSFYEDISDGFNFIIPVSEGITSQEKPYKKGETVKVVLGGISKESYGFIRMMSEQIANGGMFAKVLANVPANLKSQQAGSKNKILGWFGTRAETELSKTIE